MVGKRSVEERLGDSRNDRTAADLIPAMALLLGLAAFLLLRMGSPDLAIGAAELAVWQLMIVALVVVATMLCGLGMKTLTELNARFSEVLTRARLQATARFLAVAYGAILLLLALGGVAGLRNPFLLAGQGWKIPVLHLVAGIATTPFLVVSKRIQIAASDDSAWSNDSAYNVIQVDMLRVSLRTATTSLGAIIALAVIASGALNHAVEAAGLVPLPAAFTLVYGAWLTGVLAALYLYAFGAVERRARGIVDSTVPLRNEDFESADTLAARTKLREELSRLLQTGGDPRKNLEGLVAVFSPLISALFGLVGFSA